MANENRLKVEITKSGYQAAIDNARDANGFKIKISKADVYDDKNNLRGTFDVIGKNIGQQQIALRISVVDKTTSYGIKTIKLIDKYSGVEFAIISHPAGEMIDYINPHKIAYITCNLIITSLEDHTVTIIDSSTVDADRDMIDGQIAAIWEAIEHLPGVNLPGNQDTSGNAATASRLHDPRQIGGVFFDGSQNIDLPGVNKPGNQNTTGNAATATKLQNAANINGIPFDGSKDINVTPSGAVQFFAMETAPVGWLKANGATISRITYANLYAAIGTRFGAGDGKTTFNLPDLRGEFLRSFDDGRGVDIDRTLGDYQEDSLKSHNHCLSTFKAVNANIFKPITTGAELSSVGIGKDVITSYTGESETRPRNIALLACIKI